MKTLSGRDHAAARRAVAAGLPAILPRLWRFAWALSGAPDLADDLVQATCLRALEKASQFTPGSRLDRWAFCICRSLWLNDLRARRLRRGNGQVPMEETDIVDPSPGVEMNILAREIVEQVMALPRGQREAVMLVYVEGFSYREAAGIMQVPLGTVMSRLATARRRLARFGDAGAEGARGKTRKQTGGASVGTPAAPAEEGRETGTGKDT